MEYTKSEAKQWAKKHYKGLQGTISPSFTPDLKELDEEGIRHDVRHNINKGVFSVFIQQENFVMTLEERKRYSTMVCEEAKGKTLVSMFSGDNTVDEDIELIKHFEKVGGSHILVGWPLMFYPKNEDDIYRVTKKICDSTNLAVDLWPKQFFDFGRFHPSQFNPALIEKITEIPNVVAVKAYLGDGIGKWAEVDHRLGDKILFQAAEPSEWPITVGKYKQQYAGPADYVIFDPPSARNPRILKMFNGFLNGDFLKTMQLYWELYPITIGARDVAFRSGMLGMKYLQWLCGGNGGIFRKPSNILFQRDKDAMRAGVKAAGITPPEDEEEFYVGKLNYAKGIRLKYGI
jgi:4-hydroxy-tetrahydrodipicolinate synthase